MPARSNNRSSSGTRGTVSQTGRGRSSGGTRRGKAASRRRSGSLMAGVLALVQLTYFGRVILVLLASALIVLLDILISSNQYVVFFRLLGIELILAAVFFWLRFILRKEKE